MASSKSSSGGARNKTKSSNAPRAEPIIPNYDAQTADEVTRRLRRLSQAELAKLESYERQGQGRTTVLERIAALRGEAPWPGYDDMEAEEVNDALKKRDGDSARAVLDYERQHKSRTTIIEFAERKRDVAASSASTKRRNGAGKTGSRARPSQRSTSSEPSPAPNSSTRKRTSASTRRGSNDKPPPRSTSGAKARGSSRRGKGPQASTRSKSRSSGASRSPSSSRARTETAAKGAGRAVGAAAKGGRDVVGTAAQATGHAVGTAAKKVKGPALTAGAVAVALGGGVVLGSKLLPKRTILGIPVPGRRSRLSQAAQTLGKARNGILDAGNRVDAISKQVSAVNDGIQELASGAPKH